MRLLRHDGFPLPLLGPSLYLFQLELILERGRLKRTAIFFAQQRRYLLLSVLEGVKQ